MDAIAEERIVLNVGGIRHETYVTLEYILYFLYINF